MFLTKFVISLNQRHFYHLVTPSCWPFFLSFWLFIFVLSLILIISNYTVNKLGLYLIFFFTYPDPYIINFFSLLIMLLIIQDGWVLNIIFESLEGMHTKEVQKNLRFGFILFIISEIMFFFGFFWTYFHVSLAPAIELGCIWVPIGIIPINPFKLPLYNTLLLLSSGFSITICHMYICVGNFNYSKIFFYFTLILGGLFLIIQYNEYKFAPFAISDSVYGSIFYLLTGFHGFHVFLGLYLINYQRSNFLEKGYLMLDHHIGFECATWYWHFVDIVWLLLYLIVYFWGYIL